MTRENSPDNSSHASTQNQSKLVLTGISILGFSTESSARAAGMEKGDLIVQYNAVGNLTTEKLTALTAATKPVGSQIRVVFLRDGKEHSVTLPPGPLGISAMDTTIQGSAGQLHISPERDRRDGELSSNIVPWTVRDVWCVTGLFILFQHLIVFSVSMSGVAEMLSILMALEWKRAGWQALGFRRFDRNAVKLVCKLLLVGYLVVGVHNALLSYFQLPSYPRELARVLGGPQSLWWIFPNVVLIGPFTEEILFRGIVFAGFRQRYGWKKAAVISSGLFALAHLQFSAFVPAFVFGYIFAYLYHRTGSIWPGILTHCLINTLGFFATFSRLAAT